MTAAAALIDRLDRAVRQAVADGAIGAARSIRLHVGAPDAPPASTLLSLGDAIFGAARVRTEAAASGNADAILCVWADGQIGTVSTAISEPPVVVLTVLGPRGALHFEEGP